MSGKAPEVQAEEATLRELDALALRPELREVEGLLTQFNLFRVLRLEDGEIRHSNVLAWLLDPKETHGLGDAFLRRWLTRIFRDAPESVGESTEFETRDFHSVRVSREWRLGSGSLDLLVRVKTVADEDWVIAIENKWDAQEGDGQLRRYRAAITKQFMRARRVLVFLRRGGQKSSDPAWLETNYDLVHAVLDTLLRERANRLGAEQTVLIRHYLDILKGSSMAPGRIAELAKSLYRTHHRALDAIFEHREELTARVWEELHPRLLREGPALGLVARYSESPFVRFLPPEWNTPANCCGTAWNETDSAVILCEIKVMVGARPWFGFVESGGPMRWRKELWATAGKLRWNGYRRTAKIPKWMKPYSVSGPGEVGADEDPEVIAEQVWRWVKEELRRKDFQDRIFVVARHLKKLAPASRPSRRPSKRKV